MNKLCNMSVACAISAASFAFAANANTFVFQNDDRSNHVVKFEFRKTENDQFEPIEPEDNSFKINLSSGDFSKSAYVFPEILVTWEKVDGKEPVKGPKKTEIALKLIARSWEQDKVRRLSLHYYDGVFQSHMKELENATSRNRQWEKFFSSIHQVEHFLKELSTPDHDLTVRAMKNAVAGYQQVSHNDDVLIVFPPEILVNQTLLVTASDNKLAESLSERINIARSRLWRDLNDMETKLDGVSCEALISTIKFLRSFKSNHPKAYSLASMGNNAWFENKSKFVLDNQNCAN